MTKIIKHPEAKRSERRRKRLRSLAFLPTLITLGNLLCGFAAIYFGMRAMQDFGAQVSPSASQTLHSAMVERLLPSFLSVGAGLVVLGMVFDMFDGLVARATRSTTNFGGQLDSLADVVTCGVAPAILMVAFMTQELASNAIQPSPISDTFLGRACWVSAAIYVAFAAIRLARFNVENAESDHDHKSFRGLPSPGAGGILVSLILFQDQLGETGRHYVAYALPFVAVCTAFLMISRVPYKRFHRAYLLQKQPFGQLVIGVTVLAVFFSYKAPTLVVMVLWYGASGPIFLLIKTIRERHKPLPATNQAPSDLQRSSRNA